MHFPQRLQPLPKAKERTKEETKTKAKERTKEEARTKAKEKAAHALRASVDRQTPVKSAGTRSPKRSFASTRRLVRDVQEP